LLQDAKLQMCYVGRFHDPSCLQLDVLSAQAIEQPDTTADKHWGEVNLHLLEQSRFEELLNRIGATRDRDIIVARGRLSFL